MQLRLNVERGVKEREREREQVERMRKVEI